MFYIKMKENFNQIKIFVLRALRFYGTDCDIGVEAFKVVKVARSLLLLKVLVLFTFCNYTGYTLK